MCILSVNLFIFFSHKNVEISSSFPFHFFELYFANFLFEDSIANDQAQEPIANILKPFIFIHEISEEDGEVDNKDKEGPHNHFKYFIFDVDFLLETDVEIRN
jgi:hypothetical protein